MPTVKTLMSILNYLETKVESADMAEVCNIIAKIDRNMIKSPNTNMSLSKMKLNALLIFTYFCVSFSLSSS